MHIFVSFVFHTISWYPKICIHSDYKLKKKKNQILSLDLGFWWRLFGIAVWMATISGYKFASHKLFLLNHSWKHHHSSKFQSTFLLATRMPRILDANFMTYFRNSAGVLMVFCLVLYVFWTSTGNLIALLFPTHILVVYQNIKTPSNMWFLIFCFFLIFC